MQTNNDGAHTPARSPRAPIGSALVAGLVLRNRALAARVAELERENATLREIAQWAGTGAEHAYQLGLRDGQYKKASQE